MSQIKVGPARVTTGAHYGWKDWLAQRITGAIVLVWVVAMLVRFLTTSDASFNAWHGFMQHGAMKILTLFTILAVVYHAWIGVRDIWMDYVKNAGVRLALHLFTILWLVACAAYGLAAVLAM